MSKTVGAARERHAQRVRERMQTEGPVLWAAWHRRALGWTGGDDSPFIASLPDVDGAGEHRQPDDSDDLQGAVAEDDVLGRDPGAR